MRPSFADNLHDHALGALAVELGVENALLRQLQLASTTKDSRTLLPVS